MSDIPDLNRQWTLTDAVDALWPKGISLHWRGGVYHVNYHKGGRPKTEFVTDDLIEALTAGIEMAKHLPSVPPPIRRRRRPSRKAQIRARIRSHNRAVARRRLKTKH